MKIEESTRLVLLRDWDAPTHFFPKGMLASISYFSVLCGLSTEEFIKRYEDSLFIGWFETFKSE